MQAARQALHRGETRQSFTGKFASFHGAGESAGGGRGVSDYLWKQASPLPDEEAHRSSPVSFRRTKSKAWLAATVRTRSRGPAAWMVRTWTPPSQARAT